MKKLILGTLLKSLLLSIPIWIIQYTVFSVPIPEMIENFIILFVFPSMFINILLHGRMLISFLM
ncbi:MAG: hypothetical protein GY865_11445 [candidate division Zixibacteria bacterium]|nr:hypothetical protein [candidate division Zixibacteria bacterium]